MSFFKRKVQNNVDIPEKLVIIGRIFYDNGIRYQQREYERLLAIQKYKERDGKIQKLRESGMPQTHALRTLIAMHEDERPGELYEATKSMILDTTAEALFQLDEINRVYSTQYTVDYCIVLPPNCPLGEISRALHHGGTKALLAAVDAAPAQAVVAAPSPVVQEQRPFVFQFLAHSRHWFLLSFLC